MKATAIVYSENEFGKIDGKVANGLARHSDKYRIVGIIDSRKAGLDAGEYLDGLKNGIDVFHSLEDAVTNLQDIPEFFIYGIAPLAPFLGKEQRGIILTAMKMGMNIVNGLPEFFTDDEEFMQAAEKYNVQIFIGNNYIFPISSYCIFISQILIRPVRSHS